jgi:ribbon-helix-helix CopG family protein
MAIMQGMATLTIKSTYVMDVATMQALDRIARRWRVSKSEALRRAIRAAADQQPAESGDALQALDQLQRSLKLTPARARAWARTARGERRAASARSEARGG